MSMVNPSEARPAPPASPQSPPIARPFSPALSWGWLVRVAALCAVFGVAFGVVIAPGVRGNAREAVVVFTGRTAALLGYLLDLLLFVLLARGTLEVLRRSRIAAFTRGALALGSAVVVALSVPATFERLSPAISVVLASVAAVATLSGAVSALRAPHTRAVGGVLVLFSIAALARLVGWEVAAFAGEKASLRLYTLGQVFAAAGVVFEGLGQLTAAAWLGTRGRLVGQLLSSLAVAGAFLLTWGVAQGGHAGAPLWQAVLHTALADSAGNPPPIAGMSAVATFLVSASTLLALVAAVQPGQVVVVVGALSLALISRGTLDAPLRAMAAVAAAQWITLAMSDDRAMWRALMENRDRRVGEEG